MEVAPPCVSMNAGRSIPASVDYAYEPRRGRGLAEEGEGDGGSVAEPGASLQMWTGGVWASGWEELSPRLRQALLPSVRVAWAARLSMTTAEEGSEEAEDIERGGREESLGLLVEGLANVDSLDDCDGILGLLDALCLVSSLTALQLADCGEQWCWVSRMTCVACVSRTDVCSAEKGINELTVRDKLGGGDLLRRAIAVSLLGQLGCCLRVGGSQTITQLNIMCKNIAGVLQSLAYPAGGGGGDDEEGSTGMCRVCAVGILSTVAAKWGPSGEAGGKDPSFLLLTMRVLFAFVLCPPRGPTRAGEWCRWTAAHGLASLFKSPAVWRAMSKKSQTDSLRQILLALEAKNMDENCRVFVIRMIDNDAAYPTIANLPNYLSQILTLLLELLAPVDEESTPLGVLRELRWASLGFISRFLGYHLPGFDLKERVASGAWAAACSSQEQVGALRADVRKAFEGYCEKNALVSADVRLPG